VDGVELKEVLSCFVLVVVAVVALACFLLTNGSVVIFIISLLLSFPFYSKFELDTMTDRQTSRMTFKMTHSKTRTRTPSQYGFLKSINQYR